MGFFDIAIGSLYSRETYQQVGKAKGIGLLYLLCIVSLFVSLACANYSITGTRVTMDDPIPLNGIIDQVPAIQFDKGQASVNVSQPYPITLPGSNELLAIIDTTGKTQDIHGTKAFALLTRTQLIVKHNDRETRAHTFPEDLTHTLTREELREFTAKLVSKWWIVSLLLAPFIIAFMFLYKLLLTLIYALFGLVFARAMNKSLRYEDCVRLAAVASTPGMLLDTLIIVAPWDIALTGFAFFSITLAYLFFAVRVNE